MDRYMKANKGVTRQKREEVRCLKERRSRLKEKLHQFSSYSTQSTDTQTGISLPDVLQLTADFASGSAVRDTNMNSPSTMQQQPMDSSPCHSPKGGAAVTPAGSVANLRAADVSADVTMEDVEMAEEDKSKEGAVAPRPPLQLQGCESNALSPKSMSDVDDLISHKPPCPRHISDSELRIIQVNN